MREPAARRATKHDAQLASRLGNARVQRLLTTPPAQQRRGPQTIGAYVQRAVAERDPRLQPAVQREGGAGDSSLDLHEAGRQAAARVVAASEQERKDALVTALEERGKSDLAAVIARLSPTQLPFSVPMLLSPAEDGQPFQMAFRLHAEQARAILGQTDQFDDGSTAQGLSLQIEQQLSGAPAAEGPAEQPSGTFWILYQNDGSGINPGLGSDQGPTAMLKFVAHYDEGPLSSFAMTAIGMTTPVPGRKRTPDGGEPPAGAEDRDLMYEAGEGPYTGRAAAHFGFTVYADGSWTIDNIVTLGVDSAEWGEAVQDFIHTHISNSAHFPWPEGWRPLAENEVAARYTGGHFGTAKFRGRLEFDASALAGTQRAEATAKGRVVLEAVDVVGSDLDVSLRLGATGRVFHRHERGRESGIAGAEGGTSLGIRLDDLPQDWFVDLSWETLHSTDPTRQTDIGTDDVPLTYPEPGARIQGGGHGTGTIRVGFEF